MAAVLLAVTGLQQVLPLQGYCHIISPPGYPPPPPLQVRKAGADTSSGSLPDTSKLLPRLTPSRSLARSSPMSSSMKARINSFSSSLAAQG